MPSLDLPNKVLVVDDEPAVVAVTMRFLKLESYAVTGVTSSQEALRLIESENWDLIITDRAMPEISGEELAARVKQRTPTLPIILITGFPNAVTNPGQFESVIRKPFTPSELLTKVAQALAK